MAEERTSSRAADADAPPAYSALPKEGTSCLCGDTAHAVVTIQTGVQRCEHCGTDRVTTETLHLCELHNDLRMQGKLDQGKLLLVHRMHQSGGLKALSTDEQQQTIDLVLGIQDAESATRVWASDETGVHLLDEQEQERATRHLQRRLTQQPRANGETR